MNNDVLKRYQTAQTLLDGHMSKTAVINDAVFPHWIGETGCFWYRRDLKDGTDWRLVDARAATNEAAFDRGALTAALEKVCGQSLDAQDLPILVTEIELAPLRVAFGAFDKHWHYNAEQETCVEGAFPPGFPMSIPSPDGQKEIFLKQHNIWLRDMATGKESALTTNGAEDCEYGKVVIPGGTNTPFEALWSPDSRYVLTYRLDQRDVKTRRVLCPEFDGDDIVSTLTEYKKAYPGDAHVESYRFAVIDLAGKQSREVELAPVAVFSGAMAYFSIDQFGWWASDSSTAYLIDMERGAKAARVMAVEPTTGKTRKVFEETSDTFVELKYGVFSRPTLLTSLPETNELIWFSRRDGWGHLYLYDLNTGKLKHQITEGLWLVREILHVDVERRELIIHTAGRDTAINPYYVDICRLNIDTGELTPLATGNYEHFVLNQTSSLLMGVLNTGLESPGVRAISPQGDFIVSTRSRVDTLPISVLIDREGHECMVLEEAQDVGLPDNWVWPESFAVKAADGQTDLHGVVFWPAGFDAKKTYPLIDFSGTIHWESVLPLGSFVNDGGCGETYLTAASYAALGFIVVMVDVPGMPLRDKAFQDAHYGSVTAVNGFEDRIAAMQQLAARHSSMDLNRVGIVGYDGAAAPALGMMEKADFYKVGACLDFEDPRYGEQYTHWTETYAGVRPADSPYTEEMIAALQGKLLLINGMRASLRPFEGYLRLVDALQRQQKTFDMFVEPRGVYFVSSAQLHRIWDYFIEYLREEEPPHGFRVVNLADRKLEELQKALDESPQSVISMS